MKMQASITGNPVHEVGYRIFLLQKALGFGIQRFDAHNEVSNVNQQVIVHAEGEPDQIEAFSAFIRSKSYPEAIISDISVHEYTGYIINIIDYMHMIQIEQLSKGITAIISIDKKQDRMLDKQDQMLDKQDQMLDKQDQVIQKIDHMETAITGEIKDLRIDLRSYLDRKFSVVEQDIQQIKIKIGML
ncbi:MAG: acylphosphatase [Methanoregula sp.]|nr:acylphosphatase [Methanoregula sp.]MDD5186996.1 acylphosphatase [Methanoregula sp.]